MHIHPKGTGATGPHITKSERAAGQVHLAPSSDSRDGRSGPRITDSVQISEAGRALMSKGTDATSSGDLDEVRAAGIRARILSGAYDSLEVIDSIARTLIRSGDV